MEREIFKKGNAIHYFSAQFLPRHVRAEVFRLHSFLRLARNYVDHVPPKATAFTRLRQKWEKAIANSNFNPDHSPRDTVTTRATKNLVHLTRLYEFDPAWVKAFLDTLAADLKGKKYKTLADMQIYLHGSAEVVGLMMARLMELPAKADKAAAAQARALQWLTFIRDIELVNRLGRRCFPKEDLDKFGLKDLSETTAARKTDAFIKFVHFEIDRYHKWQAEAKRGLKYVPLRLRIPLQTVVDMYSWTARQIAKDPLVVFKHRVKPRRRRIIQTAIKNSTVSLR